MKIFIVISGILIIGCLVAEKIFATRHRLALRHVIHVNGTRGKSAVTRLIAAGIAESGMRVYCKTTGTLPMTIDTAGVEREIKRFGKANIAEQIKTLRAAAKDGAEVLVVECMAVDPELQYVCQEKILKADIGVITNVRIDHVAEMGSTIEEVCDALCNTIPKGGRLFTSDEETFAQMKERADALSSSAHLATYTSDGLTDSSIEEDKNIHKQFSKDELITEDFDITRVLFPENIALALSVCEAIGIDRSVALKGFSKVQADPYEAATFPLPGGGTFVNAMSANDPLSTKMVYERFKANGQGERFMTDGQGERFKTDGQGDGRLIVVLNNRADRGYRTELMIDAVCELKPDEVWLMGSSRSLVIRKLKKRLAGVYLIGYKDAEALPLDKAAKGDMILAIGNIANDGIKLMEIVEGKTARGITAEGKTAEGITAKRKGEKTCTDK